jgi:hypothetical protein
LKIKQLLVLASLAAIVVALDSCHETAAINGEYKIEFVWANGMLESDIVSSTKGQDNVRQYEQNKIAELAKPIIGEQVRKANLHRAIGSLYLIILGKPPYLVELQQFSIAKPNFQDLSAAVQAQDVSTIRRIVMQYQNVNQRELPSLQTATGMAAAGGHIESLRTLLELGADPNIPDYIGVTPLIAAVTAGSEDAVKMLIAGGADPTAIDNAGDSAASQAKELHREYLLPALSHSHSNTKLDKQF